MPLEDSYGIWNNKGGVGKSTITFHVAARYAERNPDTNVLVIDLCPQSNVSMMLCGGGTDGEEAVMNYCTQSTPRTVVGYLSRVLSRGAGATLPDPDDFLVQVSEHNGNMPENLFLVCGDGNLEPMAPAISWQATQPALTQESQPWRWVHLVFRKLIESILEKDPEQSWMVFVDTNPSFSIYTELAMCAVNRLIVPVNADDSSRVATNAMFILLHGQTPPHPVYGSWTFASQAAAHGVDVPLIHLIVGNRLTQYAGAAGAFKALSDATAESLYQAYRSHPSYFTNRRTRPAGVQTFTSDFSVPLRDFNTAGVVAAHLGMRLSTLAQTTKYHDVHGTEIQINKDRAQECLDAIDDVVREIE